MMNKKFLGILFLFCLMPLSAAFAKEPAIAEPGKPNVYLMVLAPEGPYKGELAVDLGFANYFKLGNMKEFKAGDLVYAAPPDQSKKGLASHYQFKRVMPKSVAESVHIVREKNPVIGDENLLHTYEAYVLEVIDGDTFKAVVDLGFGIVTKQKLRLRGLDAPEIETSEGLQAKGFLETELKKGARILIKTFKPDKYGRYLADVWVEGRNVNRELLEKKLAIPVS